MLSRVDLVLITDPPLHSRAFSNSLDPLEQMWEGFHILLRETRELPTLDPRPRPDVGDAILPLSIAGEILTRLPCILAAQLNLQHAIDAQGLVPESLDGVGDLLLGELGEVVDLALIRSAGTVPEEKPLELFVSAQIIISNRILRRRNQKR